jgi:hypothetical protein
MATIPAAVDLPLRRNTPYNEEYQFTDANDALVDFTGYTASVEIRLYGGQPGTALVRLGTVNSDAQGMRLLDKNTWRMRIDQDSLSDLPAGEPGATQKFEWDWVFTDPDGVRSAWLEGAANLKPGVTLA